MATLNKPTFKQIHTTTRGEYGATQGWLIVNQKDTKKTLEKGYTCKRRKAVPISPHDPVLGAAAALKFTSEKSSLYQALEVHGVKEGNIKEGTLYPGKRSKWIEGTNTEGKGHLPAANLRDGSFRVIRQLDHACPFCEKDRAPKFADMHSQIGTRYFQHGVELVAPGCCFEKQKKRQERLRTGLTVMLYHQTDRKSADLIKKSGKFLRGSEGTAGGAIYFALTPKETQWKTLRRGVMLECEVDLGTFIKCDVSHFKKQPPYRKFTFAHLVNPSNKKGKDLRKAMGMDLSLEADSLLLSRGNDYHKGRFCSNMPSGPEVVVFSWQQVKVKGEVPLESGDTWNKELGWIPHDLKAAYNTSKASKTDAVKRKAFEDLFYAKTPELAPYRDLKSKEHMNKAIEILVANHKARLEKLKVAKIRTRSIHIDGKSLLAKALA